MTKKLQDLQAVKGRLDELEKVPFDDMMAFLMQASEVEEVLKKAARCPKTDEEKSLAKEVKAQYQKIQMAFDKFQG